VKYLQKAKPEVCERIGCQAFVDADMEAMQSQGGSVPSLEAEPIKFGKA